MKLLADENVESAVIQLLRAEGYTVASIQENMGGSVDELVMETALSSAALLLTGDSDFGKLHFQKGQTHHGVLFYRLPKTSSVDKAQLILKVLRQYDTQLVNAFTVVTVTKIRIRKREPN